MLSKTKEQEDILKISSKFSRMYLDIKISEEQHFCMQRTPRGEELRSLIDKK